jgi:hypothetical protein
MRFSTPALELRHQANYLHLADRTPWLASAPVSSPEGSASFSLLYVLLSVLRSGDFPSILEIGVGHTTQLIASYTLAVETRRSVHLEHDATWLSETLPASPRVTALHSPLGSTSIGSRSIDWYQCEPPAERFSLVLVDGPPAASRSTRHNRRGVANWLPAILADEFVLVIDDATRVGERQLVLDVERSLAAAGITYLRAEFTGATSQILFATPGYRFAYYL